MIPSAILLASFAPAATITAAGKIVLQALNSKPAEALYDQVKTFLGPYHERHAAMVKLDQVIEGNRKLKAGANLSPEEMRALQKALFGMDVPPPAAAERPSLEARASERAASEDMRQQENMEKVALAAMEELGEADEEIKPIDPDWLERFFEWCRFISNEDAQLVWARALRIEATKEGAISRRALGALRLFDELDGRVLQELASRCVTSFGGFLWHQKAFPSGMEYRDVLHAIDIGLISRPQSRFAYEGAGIAYVPFSFADGTVLLGTAPERIQVEWQGYPLTALALDLLELPKPTVNVAFAAGLAGFLRDAGFDAAATDAQVAAAAGIRLVAREEAVRMIESFADDSLTDNDEDRGDPYGV